MSGDGGPAVSDGPGGTGPARGRAARRERGARRGPATWLVVVLTLLVVGVVGLAFVAGVGVGFWAAGTVGPGGAVAAPAVPAGPRRRPGRAPPTPPSPGALPTPLRRRPRAPPTPDAGAAPGGSGTLDPCLVGTWRTTEHSESYETEQGPASFTDLDRTMTFTADGTQTITYDSSQATVTAAAGALPAVFDGRVVYRTSTSGSTMSFQVVEAEGTVTVLGPDGEPAEENPLEPGTGDVSYTCDDTTFEQTATGYRSAYERVG